MSEAVYEEVERCIRDHLHIGRPGRSPLGGGLWAYPVEIKLGNIILRDSDCGLAKPPLAPWTVEEWVENREAYRLWRMVGAWTFILANEPAWREIEHAHVDPTWAGREIYRLRLERHDATDK